MSDSLLGPVRFEILIDEAEIAAIARGIRAGVLLPARLLVDKLAKVGVNYLRTLESRLGHHYLAGRWTYAGPTVTTQGVMAEIYNEAETEWFQKPTRRATHIIRGSQLLKILEAGAKPHVIQARIAGALAFPATIGWHTSIFKGTLRGGINGFLGGRGKHGLGAFLWKLEPNDELVRPYVHHPGVTGHRFVQRTKELLEERMALEAAALLSRVKLETV